MFTHVRKFIISVVKKGVEKGVDKIEGVRGDPNAAKGGEDESKPRQPPHSKPSRFPKLALGVFCSRFRVTQALLEPDRRATELI